MNVENQNESNNVKNLQLDNVEKNVFEQLTNNDKQSQPTTTLNEVVGVDAKYTFVEEKGPTFKIGVEVDGKLFCGVGNSKKEARFQAADEVSKSIEKFLKEDQNYSLVEEKRTSFKMGVEVDGKMFYGVGNSKKDAENKATEEVLKVKKQLLNDEMKYSLIEEIEPTFTVEIECNGKVFQGVGNSVENAKVQAAAEVLKETNEFLQCHEKYVLIGQERQLFKVGVQVGGKFVYGVGRKKEIAQKKAAEEVMKVRRKLLEDEENYSFIEEKPLLRVEINICGIVCCGKGTSEQTAKAQAAKEALNLMEKLLGDDRRYILIGKKGPTFTTKLDIDGNIFYGKGNSNKNAKWEEASKIAQDTFTLNNWNCIQEKVASFKVGVLLDGRIFYGIGHSVESAKALAAKEALNAMKKLLDDDTKYILVDQIEPVCKATVNVDGITFEGVGTTKDIAKTDAAKKALNSKFSFVLINKSKPSFTVEVQVNGKSFCGTGSRKKDAEIKAAEEALKEMNNLLCCDSNYTLTKETESSFKAAVGFNGKIYHGTGTTIESAKSQAAAEALKETNTFLQSNAKYVLIEQERQSVKMGVQIGGKFVYGVGGIEKVAKKRAAEEVMKVRKKLLDEEENYIFVEEKVPLFRVEINICGKVCCGKGISKQIAKTQAAEEAVNLIKKLLCDDRRYILIEKKEPTFTMKLIDVDGKIFYGKGNSIENAEWKAIQEASKITRQIYPKIRSWSCIEEKVASFKVGTFVDGRIFYGIGHSEESAKTLAAEEALSAMKKLLDDDTKYILIDQILEPLFKATVEVDGKIFEGEGTTKDIAKTEAAKKALNSEISYVLINQTKQSFTVEVQINGNSFYGSGHTKKNAKIKAAEKALKAVNTLLCCDSNYTLVKETEPSVKVAFEFNGKIFHGTGTTLKNAKNRAAEEVLSEMKNFLQTETKYALVEETEQYFKMNIKVFGKIFYGIGGSKKIARNQAAEKVSKELKKILDTETKYILMEENGPSSKKSVDVDGQIFHGTGSSEIAAKNQAAESALQTKKNENLKNLNLNVQNPEIINENAVDHIEK